MQNQINSPATEQGNAPVVTFTMARDQYGTTYHDLGRHPRKALLEKLGRKKASPMYVDSKSGSSRHIGYVIGGLWLTIYTVTEWSKP